jgi:LPS-assembly protein
VLLLVSPLARADDPPLCPTSAGESSAPAAAAADSRKPPGKGLSALGKPTASDKIDINGDHVEGTLGADRDVTIHGNVVVRQGDREIHAGEAHYDSAHNSVDVQGAVEYEDPLVRLRGSSGKYSPTEGADVSAAEFEMRQRSARGSAQAIAWSPQGILDLAAVTFTTCPKPDSSWLLRAKSITLDTVQQVGTGRGATVDFQGVPILYLPWISFPLSDERKSGFLFPSFGTSSTSGVELQVPYYWNIAPNADLTFEPQIYSKRGIDLSGDTRYILPGQSGELQWHFLPDDRIAGYDRSFVTLKELVDLPEDWRLHIDAADVSDANYFQDFGQGPESTSVDFVERLAQLTYRDENWRFAAQVQNYRTIDLTLPETPTDDERPYARLPQLLASADFALGPSRIVRYGFDSELVNFNREYGVTGWRFDLMPHAGLSFEGAGYFVRESVAWRYTQYELDNTLPSAARSPSRTLPIENLDTGLLFERSGDDGRTLTLEPRVQYLYVPYRDQNELPIFDTAIPDLNLVELFRTNRYVGADRQSDANQLNFGVTSRLLDTTSGQQFLAGTLGETYFLSQPRVSLPGEAVADPSREDVVAELALTAYKHWNINLGEQYNVADARSDRSFVELQFKPGPQSVINLAYRFQRNVLDQALGSLGCPLNQPSVICPPPGDLLKQAEISGAWPVARNWDVLGRMVYALDGHQAIERFAGFEYHSCCWRMRLLGRRFVRDNTGQQETSVMLELELTGLASVGSAPDSFLGTEIRGYSRRTTTP